MLFFNQKFKKKVTMKIFLETIFIPQAQNFNQNLFFPNMFYPKMKDKLGLTNEIIPSQRIFFYLI